MIEKLNEQALQKARDTIKKTFTDTSSLDDLSGLTFQIEKQLAAAQGQLNGSVQGKLDSLKRAVDLMDESSLKLSKMASAISRIDLKIAQTNTSVSNYDNLRRVHHAKANLKKVIEQVEFFAKVIICL
jgi:hypothetical protein